MQEYGTRGKKVVITHPFQKKKEEWGKEKEIIDNWPTKVMWGYDKQVYQLRPAYKVLVNNFSAPSRMRGAN